MLFCVSLRSTAANAACLISLLNLMCFTGNITAQFIPLTSMLGNNENVKQSTTVASVNPESSPRSENSGQSIFVSLPKLGANAGTLIKMNNQGLGSPIGVEASLSSSNSESAIIEALPSIGTNSDQLNAKNQGLRSSVGINISPGPETSAETIPGILPSIGTNGNVLKSKNKELDVSVGIGASLDSNNLKTAIVGSLPSIGINASALEVNDQGIGASVGIGTSLNSSNSGLAIIGSLPSIGTNSNASILEIKDKRLNTSFDLGASLGSSDLRPGIIESLPSIGANTGELDVKDQGLKASVGMNILPGLEISAETIPGILPSIGTNGNVLKSKNKELDVSVGIGASLDSNNLKTAIVGSLPSIDANASALKVNDQGLGASFGIGASLDSSNSGVTINESLPSIGINDNPNLSKEKNQGLGVSVGTDLFLTNQESTSSIDIGSSKNSLSQTESNTETNEFRHQQKESSNEKNSSQVVRKQLDWTTIEVLSSTEEYKETTNAEIYPTKNMYDVDAVTSSSVNVDIIGKQSTTNEYPQLKDMPSTSTEVSSKTWIQKITTTKKPRSRTPKAPLQIYTDEIYSDKPVWFGQVISNVLYGNPWLTNQTNSRCVHDMQIYNLHVRNYTLWAVKMLDATSKGPEGLLDGNTFSFGNFDQCMSTKSKAQGISGGYSLVDIDFRPTMDVYPGFYDGDHSKDYDPPDEDKSMWEAIKHNIQDDFVQRHVYQWAVCLPDTCQSEDVQTIVSNALIPELNRFGFEANVTINPLLHTSSKNTFGYTAGFYTLCAIYALVAVFVFVATLYDLIYLKYRPKSEHGPMKQIMKPFSLISNLERLMKPSETEEFSIINGLKVCAILQVIIGHRWFMEFGNPQANPIFVHWVIHNVWFGYFKCTIFLETFFVISGFFTFYLITKQLTERKRLNFIPILIYRWLRIFPVYGTLIATYIFILPYLNDGPYWREIIYRESERCQSNWWTNVLFINNYVHTDQLCIIPSWYLACDMHFFIIGTLLTYAIWKWTKHGLMMLGACLVISTVLPAYIILKDQHWGTAPVTPDALHDLSKDRFYTTIYIKSHMRAMTYLIGILAGYVYMKLKEADYKFSLKSRIFWAPVVLMIGNCIYLSSGIFFALGHKYVAYEHAIYFTLGRFVWSILICYGIIGHGLSGFGVCISGFLSHRIFHVTGRLVFCTYMFQEIIQLQTIASMRTPTYQNLTLMTWRFGGDTLMAMMYAFAINVMVESPFDRLQKNVMKIIMADMFSKPKSSEHSNRENINTITTSTTTLYVVNYSEDKTYPVT